MTSSENNDETQTVVTPVTTDASQAKDAVVATPEPSSEESNDD